VELGKVLASKVRAEVHACRTKSRNVLPSDGFNASTTRLLNRCAARRGRSPRPAGRIDSCRCGCCSGCALCLAVCFCAQTRHRRRRESMHARHVC